MLEQISYDLGDRDCNLKAISHNLLEYMKVQSDLKEPQNVSELFASSFFPYDLNIFSKYSILENVI